MIVIVLAIFFHRLMIYIIFDVCVNQKWTNATARSTYCWDNGIRSVLKGFLIWEIRGSIWSEKKIESDSLCTQISNTLQWYRSIPSKQIKVTGVQQKIIEQSTSFNHGCIFRQIYEVFWDIDIIRRDTLRALVMDPSRSIQVILDRNSRPSITPRHSTIFCVAHQGDRPSFVF